MVYPNQEIQISTEDAVGFDLQFESQTHGVRNRSLPPNLKASSISYDSADFVKVRCLLHSGTMGFIVVQGHPFYAVTDTNGSAQMSGLPPGNYRIAIWHEALGMRKTSEPVSLRRQNESLKLKWEDLVP